MTANSPLIRKQVAISDKVESQIGQMNTDALNEVLHTKIIKILPESSEDFIV